MPIPPNQTFIIIFPAIEVIRLHRNRHDRSNHARHRHGDRSATLKRDQQMPIATLSVGRMHAAFSASTS